MQKMSHPFWSLFPMYLTATSTSSPGREKKAFCVSSLCQLSTLKKKRFSRWWNDEIVKFHTLSFILRFSFIFEREIQFSDWKVKTFFLLFLRWASRGFFSSSSAFFNLYREGTNTNLWWNMNWIFNPPSHSLIRKIIKILKFLCVFRNTSHFFLLSVS